MSDWRKQRAAPERGRLIELGGPVVNSGLLDVSGGQLAAANMLSGDKREEALARWKQRGGAAFAADG